MALMLVNNSTVSMRLAFLCAPLCKYIHRCGEQVHVSEAVRQGKCRLRYAKCSLPTPPDSMSVPFPLGDMFSPQQVVFIRATQLSTTQRPELVGSVLWAIGLYFGLSKTVRWGSALRGLLAKSIPLPPAAAEGTATALHTLPFLFAGFAVDAGIRIAAGGQSVWAIAGGLTLAMYGGVYEAARAGSNVKKIDESEVRAYNAFQDFAARRLTRQGRCHLYDVKLALQQDAKVRSLVGGLSDEQIRRFIRAYAPSAIRSPNGYYRKLSVRTIGNDSPSF